MRQGKISNLLTEEYLGKRARRADRSETLRILRRAGKENPPIEGDEIPPDLQAIKRELLVRRYLAGKIPRIDGRGIYAFFLTNPAALNGVAIDPSGLLYLGMTESSLDIRNHFTHMHSGFSTLRRSLGALLKQELHLHATPRAIGASPTNVRNYRFLDADEERLTTWMTNHLAYGFAIVENEVKLIERLLIRDMQPPLNLKGWSNPQRRHLRVLRDVCRDEARNER